MARATKHKKKLFMIAAVAAVLLVAVLTVVLIQAHNKDDNDPYKQAEVTTQTEPVEDEAPVEDVTDTEQPVEEDASTEETTLDPATVNEIEITPMELSVSYVTGAGAFEYEVLRTSGGAQYVEFRSADLVGTKCTDDEGTFVSIIESPQSADSSTFAETTEVDGVTYGLALSEATCTSDADALRAYQKSFTDAFSLLKKIN